MEGKVMLEGGRAGVIDEGAKKKRRKEKKEEKTREKGRGEERNKRETDKRSGS